MTQVLGTTFFFVPLALLWEGGEHLGQGSVLGAVQGHCSGVRGCGAIWLEPWVLRVVRGHTQWSAVGKQMDRCVRKRTDV